MINIPSFFGIDAFHDPVSDTESSTIKILFLSLKKIYG